MTAQQIITRQARRQLDRDNAKQPAILQIVPESQWPAVPGVKKPFAVWRSRGFLVQGHDEDGLVARLSIARTTMQPDGRWADGITWDEIQGIKRQVGLGDYFAVEIFPRDKDIVNVANMRHLWVLPMPLDFGWRAT